MPITIHNNNNNNNNHNNNDADADADALPQSLPFSAMDAAQASDILETILKDNKVFVGGSSIGKGFKTAARHYLNECQAKNAKLLTNHPDLKSSSAGATLLEDAFYVVDIGVIASQVYQWRRFFPRVDPFYAVKCNPDPILIRTFCILGCHFDCASKTEIDLVQNVCADLPRSPEIIYANPCKSRNHLVHAVLNGVRMVTFDNIAEVHKCAAISDKLQLILRIVTDDRGSQCRLSSKYGAPKSRWRNLLRAAKDCGLQVVGVSFHVGSGCRDASRYEMALQDARTLFDMGKDDFGFHMRILDIGGGFPGETHSTWNPEVLDDDVDPGKEGLDIQELENGDAATDEEDAPYMFFMEIAEAVAPMIDALFPKEVRVIGEPGRYFVAAAATLVTSIVGARSNEVDEQHFTHISDAETSDQIYEMTREEANAIVRNRGASFDGREEEQVWDSIAEELNDYAKVFARQNFATQETDAYNDGLDLYKEDVDTAVDLLGIPDKMQMRSMIRSVEGMTRGIAVGESDQGLISLASAGEAVVNGMVMQAVADSAPLQDDYAYYVNDGVYGAFNNLMFDHATVRPRVLRVMESEEDATVIVANSAENDKLYASTIFGPTCDSIDVISRSVLLPKLKIGDWLYFQNMGAYTMAAASSFNGFMPTEKMYVCSVQPEFFESLIAGPSEEEKQTS
jgi:diaminopimelate decarboxylase